MQSNFKATILADSINKQGDRLTTFALTLPRMLLSELNTHRMFSRNSASSRAIPFEKMVKMVEENPFIPIAWQKDHKGMQGSEYHNTTQSAYNVEKWLGARDEAVYAAKSLHEYGVTKQLCNRLLEPFLYHTVIVTASDFKNFFELRCPKYYYEPEYKYFNSKKEYSAYHEECFGEKPQYTEELWRSLNKGQAEIHIMEIAEMMWDKMSESVPKQLTSGEWHLPFGDKFRMADVHIAGGKTSMTRKEEEETMVKIATARCARISYQNFEGKDDYEADIKLHDRLLESQHMSPMEHCCRAMNEQEYHSHFRGKFQTYQNPYGSERDHWIDLEETVYPNDPRLGWSNNVRGFIQYRAIVEGGEV